MSGQDDNPLDEEPEEIYDPRLYPDLYCRTCKDALYGWERDVCDKCRIRELQGLVSELQGLVKQCIAMLKKYAASSPEICKLIEKSMAAREMTILGGGKDSNKMHTDR